MESSLFEPIRIILQIIGGIYVGYMLGQLIVYYRKRRKEQKIKRFWKNYYKYKKILNM